MVVSVLVMCSLCIIIVLLIIVLQSYNSELQEVFW